MTEKELKKLSREDLLEMLLSLSKENEQLTRKVDQLQQELKNRTVTIKESGSLAEAALKLNGVFESAQLACDQYVQNIQLRYQQQESVCQQMEAETRARCMQMIEMTQKQAMAYRQQVEQEIQNMQRSYAWMANRMNDGR